MEEMNLEEVEFDEEKYQKNIEDNDFSNKETNGIGEELKIEDIKVEMESE